MKYLISIFLFIYGLFHFISSSEFWPIAISKTWWTPATFEFSMLQKPLFSFFLAFFHLLPLNNLVHLVIVKIVFCILGIAGLIIYSKYLLATAKVNLTQFNAYLISLALVLISPYILNNYFNIRTDQVAFLFFSLFLYSCELKKIKISYITMLLLPLIGVKEIIFFIPAVCLFFHTYKIQLTRKMYFFGSLSALAIGVWVVALNFSALNYLIATVAQYSFFNLPLFESLKIESFIFLGTLFSIVYSFKNGTNVKLSFLSLYFLLILFISPQPFSFFIGSILPFIYLPLFVVILKNKWGLIFKASPVLLQITFVFFMTYLNKKPFFESNISQLKYISELGEFINSRRFTYIDGVGIFSRNNLVPCFISPNDTVANNFCIEKIIVSNTDVVIVTGRLFQLGDQIFKSLEKNYTQIYPNFWIKNEKLTSDILAKADLTKMPLPVLLF